MVAEIDEAIGLRAERAGDHVVGAPILHDGRIKGRLVHLVLGKEPPVVGQRLVDLRHRGEIALERLGEIALAGEIRAVADPDRQRLGAERLADLDAFKIVFDGLRAGRGIGVAERTVFIGMRLRRGVGKGVGVHRVEGKAERIALCLQLLGVGLVPGNMQRDGRGCLCQLVDDGAVVELVEDAARLAEARKAGKARAAGAHAPGWDGDEELGNLCGDRLDVDAAARKICAERLVVGFQRGLALVILGCDQILRDFEFGHGFLPCCLVPLSNRGIVFRRPRPDSASCPGQARA